MKKIYMLLFVFILIKVSFAVVPSEIKRVEYFSKYVFNRRSLTLKKALKIPRRNWPYMKHFWKVFYNKKNKVIAETLYIRGCRIAYWHYKYKQDGRIIKKGYHWGGILNRAYYDMGWRRHVLKRGFTYYNSRFSYKVYDSNKKLVYKEYYAKGRFNHFVRYYYDTYGNFLRSFRSYSRHLRGAYYDYAYNGRPVSPHSAVRNNSSR